MRVYNTDQIRRAAVKSEYIRSGEAAEMASSPAADLQLTLEEKHCSVST